MKKEYVIYQSKAKQIGLSLMGVLMIAVCLFVLLAGVSENQYLMIGIGIVGCLFFGACEIFIVKQVFVGKQLVVLTQEGFYDYSSALATKEQIIPWRNVKKVAIKGVVGENFVSVYLKEPHLFLSQLSSLQRKATKANIAMGFGEININLQSAKNCNNDDLLIEMNRYLDRPTIVDFQANGQASL